MNKTKTVPVKSIQFIKELYPRLKEDDRIIARYRESLPNLPPISIARDSVLVDGFHRWQAHIQEGKTEIETEDLGNLTDVQIFNESIRRNSQHGHQLSREDKSRLAAKIWSNVAHLPPRERIKHISELLSVSQDAVECWTKDARDAEKEAMQAKAWQLWLDCYSDRQIAEQLGIDRETAGKWLDGGKSANAENPPLAAKSAKADKTNLNAPKSRQHFDIWEFQKSDGDDGDPNYFGRMPPQVVENLLWFYTAPGDIVFDPFAGGGTTHDVAKRMWRRVWTSDLAPKEGTRTIREHDILSGWPKDAPSKAALILLDPPYFSQAVGKYPKHEHQMGDMKDIEQFMDAWDTVVKICKSHIADNGRLAFIISPTQCKDGAVIDHALEMAALCIKRGLIEDRRVIVPYQTQQATGQQVEWARENKRMLKLYRDLVVFRTQ
jgi:hypothetical protein